MEHFDIESLNHFVAVARHRGLNAAARETGLAKATLSRHLRALETALGTTLMERGGGKLRLTDDGVWLLGRAAPLLADIDALADEVSSRRGQVRGRLRVSVPALMARFGFGRLVGHFAKRYPDVELEIDIADRFVEPVAEGYDLVVRANPAPDSELVGRCFLRTQSVLASVPEMPIPSVDGEIIDAIVLSASSGQSRWTVLGANGEFNVTPRERLRCSSMMLVYDAVHTGAGAALLPAWLIDQDIRTGRLKAWGSVPNRDIEVWVLHAPVHLTSPRVRAFSDFLIESYRTEKTTHTGCPPAS